MIRNISEVRSRRAPIHGRCRGRLVDDPAESGDNEAEITALDPASLPFKVENPWFSGGDIPTFSTEEVLSTKLRALLQRNKGRDLVDLRTPLKSSRSSTRKEPSTCSAST